MATVNLRAFKDSIIKAARKGLSNAATETERRLKDNVGLTDHTQEDLDNLGNPYGRRNPQQIHDPDWLVHSQTGQLKNSIKVAKENDNTYAIGADPNITDKDGKRYLEDVIEGTRKLRARNFPHFTLQELEENDIIYSIVENELDKVKL
jgi:hypothetical protein